MDLRSRCKAVLSGAVLLSLSGCTAWKLSQLATELPATGPASTLARLQAIEPPGRDRAQYLLNSGLLKLYTGDFSGCRTDLQQAKQIMASLTASSITENFAAATANETLRSYNGSATDRVLVHVALQLAYLLEGDLEGARVEALQADVTMRGFEGDDSYGQYAAARFVAGLVFEMSGERDDALISYRKAYELLNERDEAIPPALQQSLLNLAHSQGFDEEYQRYRQQFGREAEPAGESPGDWLVIYFDGIVSQKTQTYLSVFNAEANTLISVVMPLYPAAWRSPSVLNWQLGDRQLATGVMENVDVRVRQDLEHERAAILAAATVRAVAKYQMVQKSREQGELAGLLTNIATLATEQADVRSWNTLPAFIQVGRARAPLDAELKLAGKSYTYRRPEGAAGDFVLLFAYSYSPDVFSYPAPVSAGQE